jgi:hypothetical protein
LDWKNADDKVDYSKYLGPNWKDELKKHEELGQNDSMMVSNHNGVFDIFTHLTSY